MGICYLATNEINEKCYVGYTMKTLAKRRSEHERDTFSCTRRVFYNAIRKYGKDTFYWQIIYESDNVEKLKKHEIMLIELYSSHISKNGYNMTLGGDGIITGSKLSDATRKKQSISHIGLFDGKNNPFYGKTHTQETLKKMSLSLAGLSVGEKNGMFGKKHSKETRMKISKSGKRRWAKKVDD